LLLAKVIFAWRHASAFAFTAAERFFAQTSFLGKLGTVLPTNAPFFSPAGRINGLVNFLRPPTYDPP
jgi:hypothetical protein